MCDDVVVGDLKVVGYNIECGDLVIICGNFDVKKCFC